MSDDPALKGFSDLEQPYPGRRKPVNRDVKPVPEDNELWDARPAKTKYVAGTFEPAEWFYIGSLAKALGCSLQSIRLWETQGLLPGPTFRTKRTVAPVAAGRSNKGRRIWTREQIEGILALAKKHKVILNKKTPTPAFARDVARMFNELLGEN
jgi:hypothetical protein